MVTRSELSSSRTFSGRTEGWSSRSCVKIYFLWSDDLHFHYVPIVKPMLSFGVWRLGIYGYQQMMITGSELSSSQTESTRRVGVHEVWLPIPIGTDQIEILITGSKFNFVLIFYTAISLMVPVA